jgi:hypothetical protein
MADEEERIVCHSFTRARRHPLVIGKIQGHALPFMLSPTQLGVLVFGVVGLVMTRAAWGPLVGGGPLEIVVISGVPAGLAFAARHLRMEGRSPLRMAVGLGVYATRRSVGTEMLGRPVRDRAPRRLGGPKVPVSAGSPKVSVCAGGRPPTPKVTPDRRDRRRPQAPLAVSPKPGPVGDGDPAALVCCLINAAPRRAKSSGVTS